MTKGDAQNYSIGSVFDFTFEMTPIEPEEFEAIQKANQILNTVLEVETELLTMFMAYADLSNTILTAASRVAVFGYSPLSTSNQTSLIAGAKLDFWLAVFRRYVDKIAEQAQRSTGSDLSKIDIDACLSKIYDGSEEYRLLYDLRNYAMHRSSVAENITYSIQTDPNTKQHYCSVSIAIEVRKLLSWHEGNAENKKRLSRSVHKDLSSKDLDSKLFLTEYIRKALPLLLEIHFLYRNLTSQIERNCLELLNKFTDQWLENNQDRGLSRHDLIARKTHKNKSVSDITIEFGDFYSRQLDEIRQQTETIPNNGPLEVRM